MGSINFLEQLTKLKKQYTYIGWLIMSNILKDTYKQPDEEIHRVRFRRI
jgi:hypothetical protein